MFSYGAGLWQYDETERAQIGVNKRNRDSELQVANVSERRTSASPPAEIECSMTTNPRLGPKNRREPATDKVSKKRTTGRARTPVAPPPISSNRTGEMDPCTQRLSLISGLEP